MTNPCKSCGQGLVTGSVNNLAIFKFWSPNHIFRMGEAEQFEVGVQIGVDKY